MKTTDKANRIFAEKMPLKKDTLLYKAMKKYRKKFLVYLLIALALLCAFAIWRFPYIKTKMFGATQLDTEEFLKNTQTFTIDGVTELDRHDPKEPDSYYYKAISYWQKNSYLFDMTVDSIEKTGIIYSSKIELNEKNMIEYESAEIYLAELGGRKIAVIALPHQKYGKHLTGFLVKAPKPVISDLSKKMSDELTISEYFIDCRGVDMGTESTDFTILKIWAAILLILFAKLGVYYARPELTPTYRQLRKYGDVNEIANDIEVLIHSETAYTENKMLITDDYILSDDTFKKKVVKNHMVN